MQIIAGKFRGKKLSEYYNETTRPTTARVKENIFNILAAMGVFSDERPPVVLDLFAGTGQYGLETISRTAREVIFNDNDPAATKVITHNLKTVSCTKNGAVVFNLPYDKCLEKFINKKFDLVFLDPPYADETAAPRAINFLRDNAMLADDAVIVYETETPALAFSGFTVRQKKYGRAVVYFLTQANITPHKAQPQ